MVNEDGSIFVWLTDDQEQPIIFTQKLWAQTLIAVEQANAIRHLELCDRRWYEQRNNVMAALEPDWVERSVVTAENADAMWEERLDWHSVLARYEDRNNWDDQDEGEVDFDDPEFRECPF